MRAAWGPSVVKQRAGQNGHWIERHWSSTASAGVDRVVARVSGARACRASRAWRCHANQTLRDRHVGRLTRALRARVGLAIARQPWPSQLSGFGLCSRLALG